MALAAAAPRCLRPRGRPRTGLALALAAVVAHLCWDTLDFTAGLLRPLQPASGCSRIAGPSVRLGRLPRASRGGEAADGYTVGDRVKARSPDDEQWYPGAIEAVNGDGTFTVRWDDPEGGPETNDLAADALEKVVVFKDYAPGDDVQAASPDDGQWYPGTVVKASADGTFQVRWDDPDGGPETADAKPHEMKKVTVFKDYKVGEAVEAVFPEDGQMYPGTVTQANDDGTFQVKWDDPDGGPEDSACKPKDMKYPPIPFEKLEVGQKYKGTVKSITSFGAFVDIGAEGEGLVHISRIAEQRIEDVRDFLEEGQEVDVWISGLQDNGKFGLTMIEGRMDRGGGRRAPADLSAFQGVSPDEWQTGTVGNIAPFGAFVTVTLPNGGPSADGLVHIAQIRDGFVENIWDELEVGQEVQVRVTRVDVEAGRMSLSMKPAGSGGAPRAAADLSAFEGVAPDQWLTGTVARTAPFGAFVTVTLPDGGPTADGLVHITQIRDGFVESVEDELQQGQEVQVRVTDVDTGAGKLSLSMKPEAY
mmetsp:Transcript_58336/g.176361  ORF Transcript_58336/g.176361 Transcript_58336/m.176361 type:complete len:532 (+) Transcript_58336:42-1637(+)